MKKCTDCQHFTAWSPWVGHCHKAGCRADYSKSACGKFRQASPEKLARTAHFMERFKKGDYSFKCKECEE